jgi:hypothetical protein
MLAGGRNLGSESGNSWVAERAIACALRRWDNGVRCAV